MKRIHMLVTIVALLSVIQQQSNVSASLPYDHGTMYEVFNVEPDTHIGAGGGLPSEVKNRVSFNGDAFHYANHTRRDSGETDDDGNTVYDYKVLYTRQIEQEGIIQDGEKQLGRSLTLGYEESYLSGEGRSYSLNTAVGVDVQVFKAMVTTHLEASNMTTHGTSLGISYSVSDMDDSSLSGNYWLKMNQTLDLYIYAEYRANIVCSGWWHWKSCDVEYNSTPDLSLYASMPTTTTFSFRKVD